MEQRGVRVHTHAESGSNVAPRACELVAPRACEHAPYESSNADHRAWSRLMEALAAGDKLSKWLGQRPPELDRRQAFDTLADILRSEQIGHAGDESGYVRVLSAASVRSLRIPYLFLAGLSEKAFPPPDREDRLYSEADYLRLIDEGLPLIARTERNREEMLLFYEAITRATQRLYLSYPALDSAAQPLSPSPYLKEVEQACDGRIPRTERADLSPIPPDDEPLCEAEFRVKAVAMALDGNVALLAGLMRVDGGLSPHLADNLVAGMELTHLRQDRDHFGAAEGVLRGSAAGHYLSARFPSTHTFSATELEQYASCPFRYFLDRILKVEPLEDLTLEFDVLERGRLAHDVLAAFHRRANGQLGRPSSPLKLDATEFDRLLAVAIDESLPPASSNPVQAALREVDRRQVTQWLAQYRTQCEKYDKQWQGFESPMAAELFEVSFGRGNGEPPSCDRPLELTAENQTVRIEGRIDRIDCGIEAGHAVFNVLDYKTGGSVRFTPETVAAGTALQLPLYALAAMELLLTDRDALPWQAGYWYLREDGFKPRQALRMYRNDDGRIQLEPAWEQMRAGLADTVVGLVGGIRRGQFPVCSRDDRCTGYCPFSTVCRINQVRSLEKICQPTAELA
jgi:ATP-dependent helicase/DNAse subunit B